MKKTPLVRKTRLRAKRPTPRTHKLVIRLTGRALTNLRLDCFARDKGICQKCGAKTYYHARFPGDKEAYDMSHIKSRGAMGSDELSNVRCLCHECHMASHTEGKR